MTLIEQIYEAAALPELWPVVLGSIAKQVGAVGGVIMTASPQGGAALVSRELEGHLADYVAEGWAADPERTAPLLAEQFPGFRVETDFRTVEQVQALRAHARFLDPRGLIAGAATAIQGTNDSSLFLAFEGFPSHDASRAAVPWLDTVRPHLARAISLTALHRTRTQLIVDSLALAAAAAAVIDSDGRLRAANSAFTSRMADQMIDRPRGVRFRDPFLQQQFANALARHKGAKGAVQSVGLRDPLGGAPFVIHLLPIVGAARELCDGDGILLLIADRDNASVPDADLLRLLFDLTPAEARLTRLIVEGHSLGNASLQLGISPATARAHLKSVFFKTGVARQAELVRLLLGLGQPRI